MSAPIWSQVVADLMVAVESTQHAYKSTRVLKRKLSTDESRRVMAFHQEVDNKLQRVRSISVPPAPYRRASYRLHQPWQHDRDIWIGGQGTEP